MHNCPSYNFGGTCEAEAGSHIEMGHQTKHWMPERISCSSGTDSVWLTLAPGQATTGMGFGLSGLALEQDGPAGLHFQAWGITTGTKTSAGSGHLLGPYHGCEGGTWVLEP